MKVFVDANILVSVLNKEYPLFTHSASILSLSGNNNFEIYTSPICLAIAFYFAEKKHKTKLAREKIALLCKHIFIAPATANVVQKTIANKKINDFEDGLEYYSAIESYCEYIVTEDVDDFYFSEIPVMNARNFFRKLCCQEINLTNFPFVLLQFVQDLYAFSFSQLGSYFTNQLNHSVLEKRINGGCNTINKKVLIPSHQKHAVVIYRNPINTHHKTKVTPDKNMVMP